VALEQESLHGVMVRRNHLEGHKRHARAWYQVLRTAEVVRTASFLTDRTAGSNRGVTHGIGSGARARHCAAAVVKGHRQAPTPKILRQHERISREMSLVLSLCLSSIFGSQLVVQDEAIRRCAMSKNGQCQCLQARTTMSRGDTPYRQPTGNLHAVHSNSVRQYRKRA